ncbi:di-heme oxidoredictase family protein [Dokdonella koreensis]|uniref:Thiol oxidoreductase n=1 Tax=Dokdonella koreensis DS-123 TaxID=1300342 RepID=A0A167GWM3_9GAMM|nr:di-heme oxidoredictase family protein [Dokdonella koreensis]ANB17942.1 Putative thiol oxidoreductase [Dokdonella koreensis DS-123]
MARSPLVAAGRARWRRRTAACLLLPVLAAAGASAPPARSDLSPADRERVRAIVAPATDFSVPEAFESLPAGAATVRDKPLTRDIFSFPSANLDFAGRQRFAIGNGLFRKDWVSAPSSTQASDGLGPLFNARSCQGCHLKDGRGVVPVPGEPAVSLFLRLSIPPRTVEEKRRIAERQAAVIAEPTYGTQLQNFAVPGLAAEGQLRIDWSEQPVALAGGETVVLRRPSYRIVDLGYGPLHEQALLSPRLAPPMIGLGLVEAIHEDDILAHAARRGDPDGVVGKVGRVRDAGSGRLVLGRFGWKGGQPDVRQQAAHAFSGDMGLSTPLLPDHWGDCSAGQSACRSLPHGAQPAFGPHEISGELLDFVAFYSSHLAVPARRAPDDARVLAGKRLFYEARCTACHVPKFVTRRDAPAAEHRFQLIWPYSDFLLHDMGEGLADGRPEGDAGGREWRTPPLWGIGLATTVEPRATFLHDGRARSVLEAILWHGGEAQAARDRVVGLSPAQRADLIRFVESL